MITNLDFAKPFFNVNYLTNESEYDIDSRSILINISDKPIRIQNQKLLALQSVIVSNTALHDIDRAVIVEDFDSYKDENELLESIRQTWPLAFDVRKEERLKGVSHYMSPKNRVDNIQFSMYHSASVPLDVGLHKVHTHCGDKEPREIHTQIVGFGKMQQCLKQDINTLYLEEMLAPGATHKPMYDNRNRYPWHQYETITPSVFMAIELLSD